MHNASGLNLWGPGRCPAAATALDRHKGDPVSEARREGDAAHQVAMHALDTGELLPIGFITDSGVPVDADMIEGAELWVETLGGGWTTEETVSIPGMNDGRIDAWRMTGDVLEIAEYKYGHRHVDAVENWQLIAYAIGLAREYDAMRFTLTIVQPRSYSPGGPVRTWGFDATIGVLNSLSDKLNLAITAAREEPTRQVTGDYCLLCPGKHECASFLSVGDNAVDLSGYADPVELSPGAVSKMLVARTTALDRLKAQVDALEELAIRQIKGGANLPHWQMTASQGREKWTTDSASVIALGEALGLDLRKPLDCITPAQARKAGLSADDIAQIAERPPGAAKLTRFDPRDAARRLTEGSKK